MHLLTCKLLNKPKIYLIFLICLSQNFFPANLYSWPGKKILQKLHVLPKNDFKKIDIHKFISSQKTLQMNSEVKELLYLMKTHQISFDDGVSRLIKRHIDLPDVKINIQPLKLLSHYKLKTSEVILSIDEIPFCRFQVKAYEKDNGEISLLGKVPNIDQVSIQNYENWPNKIDTKIRIENFIREEMNVDSVTEIKSRKCFDVSYNEAVPVWESIVRAVGKSYKVLANEEEVLHSQALFLDVVPAKIQAYKYNKFYNNGELEVFKFDLNATGYLENSFFVTDPDDYDVTKERVIARNYEFLLEPDDEGFVEVNAFAHASRMLDYFKSIGFVWDESETIILKLHAILCSGSDCSKNNAQYEPGSANQDGTPIIILGDGDASEGEFEDNSGQVTTFGLQNLSIDSDVVSHELSHHIVFKVLKETSGESLRLHEGLADFFTFASTKDSCLGESICPENSLVCMVSGKCLRTASTTLTYHSDEYNAFPYHLQSQLISGLLWDLQEDIGLPTTETMVLHSLNYFTQDTNYRHFIVALMLADKDLNESANACKILEVAIERGLDDKLDGITCTDSDSWEEDLQTVDSDEVETDIETETVVEREQTTIGCGVIKSHHHNSFSILQLGLFIMMFFCPLVICYIKSYDGS